MKRIAFGRLLTGILLASSAYGQAGVSEWNQQTVGPLTGWSISLPTIGFAVRPNGSSSSFAVNWPEIAWFRHEPVIYTTGVVAYSTFNSAASAYATTDIMTLPAIGDSGNRATWVMTMDLDFRPDGTAGVLIGSNEFGFNAANQAKHTSFQRLIYLTRASGAVWPTYDYDALPGNAVVFEDSAYWGGAFVDVLTSPRGELAHDATNTPYFLNAFSRIDIVDNEYVRYNALLYKQGVAGQWVEIARPTGLPGWNQENFSIVDAAMKIDNAAGEVYVLCADWRTGDVEPRRSLWLYERSIATGISGYTTLLSNETIGGRIYLAVNTNNGDIAVAYSDNGFFVQVRRGGIWQTAERPFSGLPSAALMDLEFDLKTNEPLVTVNYGTTSGTSDTYKRVYLYRRASNGIWSTGSAISRYATDLAGGRWPNPIAVDPKKKDVFVALQQADNEAGANLRGSVAMQCNSSGTTTAKAAVADVVVLGMMVTGLLLGRRAYRGRVK